MKFLKQGSHTYDCDGWIVGIWRRALLHSHFADVLRYEEAVYRKVNNCRMHYGGQDNRCTPC